MDASRTRITCTRRIAFDAAHRVMLHESKCKHLHGHRYTIEATFSADALDELGRVVDFGVIKALLGAWVDSHWDHTTILHAEDRALGEAICAHSGQVIYYLPTNPTAENMAAYLVEVVCPRLFASYPILCEKIRLWETPNCYAEAYSG
jgi:6-pyruvoyltetrahydropterin/6-carboxytetrahydropterin synthase